MTRAQSAFAIGSFALLLFALIKIRNLEHKLAASGALAEQLQLDKDDLRVRMDGQASITRLATVPAAAGVEAARSSGVNVCPPVSDGLSKSLLQAHGTWDWKAIATELLSPWGMISQQQLQLGVDNCFDNGTMYCARLQVHQGNLYLTDYRAIFFDRHYAPSRILPLLETLRRHPDLPDLDIVVAGNDEPRVASKVDSFSWTRMCKRWPGTGGKLPPPMFAATINRAVLDLPWVDFAWFFPRGAHKLRTPPWSKLHGQLAAAGRSVGWDEKVELAMHTGNVGSMWRQKLVAEAKRNADTILVNELFIGDHGKIRKTCRELGLHSKGGFQQHKCYMPFADQCRYKYLLNVASIGYANKFKSLLLCGSVVLYVNDGMRHKEFYEYGLLPGVHYVAVDSSADVPAMVRWLQKNDDYARAVGEAGRARMLTLDVKALTDFMAEVFRQYARRQQFRVAPQPGAVRIDCEDDLWRHYSLDKGWMQAYKMEDNATCVHPIPPGTKLGPPGWGGAYAGSKPRCVASHDMGPKAQPEACRYEKPFSTAESWEPFDKFPTPHPANPQAWGTT